VDVLTLDTPQPIRLVARTEILLWKLIAEGPACERHWRGGSGRPVRRQPISSVRRRARDRRHRPGLRPRRRRKSKRSMTPSSATSTLAPPHSTRSTTRPTRTSAS